MLLKGPAEGRLRKQGWSSCRFGQDLRITVSLGGWQGAGKCSRGRQLDEVWPEEQIWMGRPLALAGEGEEVQPGRGSSREQLGFGAVWGKDRIGGTPSGTLGRDFSPV